MQWKIINVSQFLKLPLKSPAREDPSKKPITSAGINKTSVLDKDIIYSLLRGLLTAFINAITKAKYRIENIREKRQA